MNSPAPNLKVVLKFDTSRIFDFLCPFRARRNRWHPPTGDLGRVCVRACVRACMCVCVCTARVDVIPDYSINVSHGNLRVLLLHRFLVPPFSFSLFFFYLQVRRSTENCSLTTKICGWESVAENKTGSLEFFINAAYGFDDIRQTICTGHAGPHGQTWRRRWWWCINIYIGVVHHDGFLQENSRWLDRTPSFTYANFTPRRYIFM